MMFERYGHVFSHSGRRVAQDGGRNFCGSGNGLSYNCRKCRRSLRQAAQTKTPKSFTGRAFPIGGDEETRTPDPLHAKAPKAA